MAPQKKLIGFIIDMTLFIYDDEVIASVSFSDYFSIGWNVTAN